MAFSIGNLMSSASGVQPAYEQVNLWRRTYNINDPRPDVARKLGDGTARQGKIVITAIIDAAKEWFDTENKEARARDAAAQLANGDHHVDLLLLQSAALAVASIPLIDSEAIKSRKFYVQLFDSVPNFSVLIV